ncbi:uncharacterized protein IL334_003460 [Kwoniella shivajii]|uniref:JmjC domain-containing protein n=1 Tax=Kwoniella shivajii TaxID=564305 RepID=A0ABZ1D0K9_9TREE|nr:hypothetical protein IL334_003460 [Kwoniella shivajii]
MTSLIPSARCIPRITPSRLREHLATPSPRPLHLPGLIAAWPALSQWRLSDQLREIRNAVGEERAVEVELGRKGRGYLDPDWQRVNLGFGIFLDAFIFNMIPSSAPKSQLPSAYLAQSDLLDSCPQLAEAVPLLPHFYQGSEKSLYRRTVWIGPDKSFTPFHKDPYVGIYSQGECQAVQLYANVAVQGNKIFHVLPPESAQHLSPSGLARHTNTSQIPLPVSRIFPRANSVFPNDDGLGDLPMNIINTCRSQLEKAFAMDGACEVYLKEGESVLIPEGWWHAAEGGDGPGVGVGAWFR